MLYRLKRGSREVMAPNDNRHNRPPFAKVRNILNIIFLIGAIVGLGIYYTVSHQTGIIVILCAMVFKFAECILRMFKR